MRPDVKFFNAAAAAAAAKDLIVNNEKISGIVAN